jgi:hypothetical protein
MALYRFWAIARHGSNLLRLRHLYPLRRCAILGKRHLSPNDSSTGNAWAASGCGDNAEMSSGDKAAIYAFLTIILMGIIIFVVAISLAN